VTVTGTKKCDCPFKLWGKPIPNEGWVLKVICGTHNYTLFETLVDHPYVGRLKPDEHVLLVDMTKSQVRATNILLTLKENNLDNVTISRQLYNAKYTYKISPRGSRTEMQHLMTLLERD